MFTEDAHLLPCGSTRTLDSRATVFALQNSCTCCPCIRHVGKQEAERRRLMGLRPRFPPAKPGADIASRTSNRKGPLRADLTEIVQLSLEDGAQVYTPGISRMMVPDECVTYLCARALSGPLSTPYPREA
jgi:hypothetical protein